MQPGFKPSDREEVSINQQEDMLEKQAALGKGVCASVKTCEPEGKQHLGQKGHSQHLLGHQQEITNYYDATEKTSST
jgi:hypothetical protein